MQLCIVHVVKEVASFCGAQSIAHNRTRTRALQTSRKKAGVDYEETGII